MATYVIRNGVLIDKESLALWEMGTALRKRSDFPAPVVRSFDTYRSPVDGREIASRSARRDDLERNDCIPWEPGLRQDIERNSIHKRTPGWSKKHNRPIKDGKLV